MKRISSFVVIPAQAGTQSLRLWIPACAGMTNNQMVNQET